MSLDARSTPVWLSKPTTWMYPGVFMNYINRKIKGLGHFLRKGPADVTWTAVIVPAGMMRAPWPLLVQ